MPIQELRFTCIHQGNLNQEHHIKTFVEDGSLVIIGLLYCEDRVPTSKDDCDGKIITCVGPNNPDCPSPDHAKLTSS